MGDMDQEFWNESYKQDPNQGGEPDRFLAQEVVNLSPGSAVDLGCGMGRNHPMSVDEIAALLSGLQIEKDEVWQVDSPFSDAGQEQSDTKANVLLVRAQKTQKTV